MRRPLGAYQTTKVSVFYGGDAPKVAKFSDHPDAVTFAQAVSRAGHVAEVADASGVIARFKDGRDAMQHVDAADLLAELKALARAYHRLMADGRERILALGGTCDALATMEQSDPALRAARAMIDRAEVA